MSHPATGALNGASCFRVACVGPDAAPCPPSRPHTYRSPHRKL